VKAVRKGCGRHCPCSGTETDHKKKHPRPNKAGAGYWDRIDDIKTPNQEPQTKEQGSVHPGHWNPRDIRTKRGGRRWEEEEKI